jgi:heat shock protein HtpX
VVLFALTVALRAHSRRRGYRADTRPVAATGDPVSLACALVMIERVATPKWSLLSPLYLNDDEAGTLRRLLATHPPLDGRVERRVGRADELRGR